MTIFFRETGKRSLRQTQVKLYSHIKMTLDMSKWTQIPIYLRIKYAA